MKNFLGGVREKIFKIILGVCDLEAATIYSRSGRKGLMMNRFLL